MPDKEEYQMSFKVVADVSSSATAKHLPTQLEMKLFEFCHSELEKTMETWKERTQKNSQGVTSAMLRIVTNSCIVASAICGLTDMNHQRVRTLESLVDKLAHSISNFLVRESEQYKVDAIIETCTRNLPEIEQLSELTRSSFRRAGIFALATHLSKALVSRIEVRQSFHVDDDFMEIDEEPNSQLTAGVIKPDGDVPRHDLQAASDAAALRATCSVYCRLISSIEDQSGEQDYVPRQFVEYIASIHEAELLRCRPFIKSLLSSRYRLHKDSCLHLVERLSDALLDPLAREYNTSEVANGMVVEVLIGTTADWDLGATDKDTQDLYQSVEDIYAYYVKGMEKGGLRRSLNVQKALANFLHGLLAQVPDFGKSSRATPSVRTSLFELLAQGEVAVKYHVSRRLPAIFEYFVLPEHDKILQDIDDSLPSDIQWKEGLAIRLLVLAKLASQWYTLLRQGVYRIFATAGSVTHATEHAKKCIENVAKARKLSNSQVLFRLFAPQIIFTWLDRKRKFSEIPYLAFSYTSLQALIRDIESEAVSQAIMLGLKTELEYLARTLETSVSVMLARNIGKAAAYTISWDTCKGSARNKSTESNAKLLCDLIGADQYSTLLQIHFPGILGCILQTIDQEERITKPLEKRTAFAPAARALAEMNNISHSTQKFELGIEPSFNAYYLIDQVERLCRRTNYNLAEFWRPEIYTFIMRMLLDRLHPALGSLHARSVIRKIRILVALAGEVAFEGYPLEMSLQSLRPFITDIQCAEDTLGIVQYLFEHGAAYLRSNLSFVTGIGLSILISIRVFLGTSQESTTQESQHTATMNKAERFHKWLTQYLETYANSINSSEKTSSIRAFKSITTAASRIRAEGNSINGTEESILLVQILDDVRSNRKLLNNTSREVALDLLCQHFQPAPCARDDILGSDVAVAAYAPQVWESCQRNNIGDGYMLWAARVLGRAFSAHGEVKRTADRSRPWIISPVSSKSSLGRTSREAIIERVLNLFYSDDRKEASLAEGAARRLILRLPNYPHAAEVTNKIRKPIADALNLPMPTEPSEDLVAPYEELEQSARPTTTKPVSVWVRDLAVSLCQIAAQDPVLGSLSKLLMGIEDMSATLFPYILHLVLLEEYDGDCRVRQAISKTLMSWLSDCDTSATPYVRILIRTILYLRSQPVPKENTRVDRDQWLEVDYLKASRAAAVCGMFRSSLLFAETSSGQPIVKQASRRSSVLIQPPSIPIDLQLLIYKNLDEPDSFYGVDRGYSLSTVLDRLDHEADGIKSMLFRGARLDSQIRHSNSTQPSDSRGFIKSLINLNLNNITHTLLSNDQFRDIGDEAIDSTLHAARKLGQWDIKAPEGNHTESSTLFKAFQGLHYASDIPAAKTQLDRQLLVTMKGLTASDKSGTWTKPYLRTLAVLAETDDFINTPRPEQLLDLWDQFKSRENWMRAGE